MRGWVGDGSRLQWPPCKGPVKRSRSPGPRGEAHRQMGKPRRYTVTLGSTREAKAPCCLPQGEQGASPGAVRRTRRRRNAVLCSPEPKERSDAGRGQGEAPVFPPSTKLPSLCASARSQGPCKGRSEGPMRGWVGEGSRLQWPPCKGPVKRSRSPDPRGEAHRQMGKPRRYTVTLGSTREAKAPTRAARRWAHAALD